jgi:drug/metabolite transporter (DMT)-like permease
MSLWFFLVALVPPVMFAVSNLIDKSVMHGEEGDESPWAVVALGAFFDLIFLIPIGLYCLVTINWPMADIFWPLFFNGISVTLAGWLFYRSIQTEETSRVVAIFQTIPIFGLFLGFYGLEEKLGWEIILAIIFLVLGGFTLSISKGKFNKRILAMMLLSSALYAVNDFVLAKYGREIFGGETGNSISLVGQAMPAIMADLAGKVFFGIIVLVGRRERTSFKNSFRAKFGLVGVSSIIYTAGDVVFDLAKLFAPIALVQALGCTQPMFVLIWGILSTSILIPYLLKKRNWILKKENRRIKLVEKTTKFCLKTRESLKGTTWKVVGIILMVVGGILLSI